MFWKRICTYCANPILTHFSSNNLCAPFWGKRNSNSLSCVHNARTIRWELNLQSQVKSNSCAHKMRAHKKKIHACCGFFRDVSHLSAHFVRSKRNLERKKNFLKENSEKNFLKENLNLGKRIKISSKRNLKRNLISVQFVLKSLLERMKMRSIWKEKKFEIKFSFGKLHACACYIRACAR